MLRLRGARIWHLRARCAALVTMCYNSNPLAVFGQAVCCLLIVVLFLLLFIPVLGWLCMCVLVVYLLVMTCRSICAVEVHSVQEAAAILYNYNKGRTPGLPAKLQGVFWMSTNAAPEMLASMDGSNWDPERKILNLDSGATYNWTYSADLVGTIYWFFLRVSYMFCSELHLKFNDDLTEASMPLYVCGFCKDFSPCDGCWMPMGMWWTMSQDEGDENTWNRDIYLYCNPNQKWDLGSYKLVRIIDENGQKLPAYSEMEEQMKKSPEDAEDAKFRAIYAKPSQQIMNGSDCVGNVLFGRAGNPEEYMQLP